MGSNIKQHNDVRSCIGLQVHVTSAKVKVMK